MKKEGIDVKKELITILDYYKYLILNDGCTIPAIISLSKMLAENLDVEGTVEDFAKFYGVSEANVRNVINRYLVDKPKRRVFYKFHPFTKIIPSKWLNNRS